MFLKRQLHSRAGALGLALGLFTLTLTGAARAQTDGQVKNTLQMGLDAWHLDYSHEDKPRQQRLLMADNKPAWKYREASPWLTLQSQVRMGTHGELELRARANQNYGGQIDQLSYAHAISPSLGLRAGVLDFRATWCRSHDTDNPWVRENDPFCTVKSTSDATASAPALQAYTVWETDAYQFQANAGLFRPKALGYAPREFNNLVLPPSAHVTQNNKQSLSVNALNKETATEWRLSWIGAHQRFFDSGLVPVNPGFAPTQLNFDQNTNAYFAGVSWPLSRQLSARLTHLNSASKAHCEQFNPNSGPACTYQFKKSSTVLELNYQANPTDVLSLALTQYPAKQAGTWGGYDSVYRSSSVSWRRNWTGDWFTAVQVTRANSLIRSNNSILSYAPGTASAWGLGLRLGYKL